MKLKDLMKLPKKKRISKGNPEPYQRYCRGYNDCLIKIRELTIPDEIIRLPKRKPRKCGCNICKCVCNICKKVNAD